MPAERHPSQAPARQRGLSIIELMIGMVVSLIVGLVATGSAVMFGASQRQGIGVGGVAVNINTAMMALKNDVASAGLGFFGQSRSLCNTLNLAVSGVIRADGAAFAPLNVTKSAGGDRIDVWQASRVEAGATAPLVADSDGSQASLKSFLPAALGDAVLVAPDSANAADPCLVRTVTANTAAVDETPQSLGFGVGSGHNADPNAFTAHPTYAAGSTVTLLGQMNWRRYSLDNHNLLLEQPLTGQKAVLARDVMTLRAQYGISEVGGKTLTQWVDADSAFATLNAANIARVRALRVGVVARSPQRDKACDGPATVPDPLEPGVKPDVTPDVPDPQCYRFRSAVLVIPLRNLMLGIK
jgi:type IV pilus assembly protein PilW